MSAFIFGNMSIRKEHRSGANLRCNGDLLTYQQRNLNDELDSYTSRKPKHTSLSGNIYKKQKTGVDISDTCRQGPYNAEAHAGPSRLNSFAWPDLSKEESSYSFSGRARIEKYADLQTREKERLSRSPDTRLQLYSGPTLSTDLQTEQKERLSRSPDTRLQLYSGGHTPVLLELFSDGSAVRNQQQACSDEELDNLWVGVRKHGIRNWEAMLRDPKLWFSCFKTAEDLEARWNLQDLNKDFPCLNGARNWLQ